MENNSCLGTASSCMYERTNSMAQNCLQTSSNLPASNRRYIGSTNHGLSKTMANPNVICQQPELVNSSTHIKINNTITPMQSDSHGAEIFEDIDEEDISDDEDTERYYQTFKKNSSKEILDNKDKGLLGFADMLNKDIHKYFGKKNDPDWCDIYEDKWVSGKSGKELYYADLLKIAQGSAGNSEPVSKDLHTSKKRLKMKKSLSGGSTQNDKDTSDKNKTKCTPNETLKGTHEPHIGLGPLEELFHVCNSSNNSSKGIRNEITNQSQVSQASLQKNLKPETHLPMVKRKLPESFWAQPDESSGKRLDVKRRFSAKDKSSTQIQLAPDFADLLESWGPE